MKNLNFHRLFNKQIRKYLSEDFSKQERFQQFIKAVNDSYVNFEWDKELFENSSKLNKKIR